MSYIKGLVALSLMMFAGSALSINDVDAKKHHAGEGGGNPHIDKKK